MSLQSVEHDERNVGYTLITVKFPELLGFLRVSQGKDNVDRTFLEDPIVICCLDVMASRRNLKNEFHSTI